MFITAIIILIIILISANIGLKVFNNIYPPCESINDYFQSAKLLSDDLTYNLRTIPSTLRSSDYIGVQPVDPIIPVVNIMTKPGSEPNKKLFDAVNAMFPANSQEETSTTKISNSYNGSNAAVFELEMEGQRAYNKPKNQNNKDTTPTKSLRIFKNDGYKDRRPNDF
jgi:hypothetical protein